MGGWVRSAWRWRRSGHRLDKYLPWDVGSLQGGLQWPASRLWGILWTPGGCSSWFYSVLQKEDLFLFCSFFFENGHFCQPIQIVSVSCNLMGDILPRKISRPHFPLTHIHHIPSFIKYSTFFQDKIPKLWMFEEDTLKRILSANFSRIDRGVVHAYRSLFFLLAWFLTSYDWFDYRMSRRLSRAIMRFGVSLEWFLLLNRFEKQSRLTIVTFNVKCVLSFLSGSRSHSNLAIFFFFFIFFLFTFDKSVKMFKMRIPFTL